jgi:hypothetical protein
MFRTILIFGSAAGLLVGIPLSLLIVAVGGEPPPYGMAIGYALMLMALSLVFVAIKRQRDEQGGGVIKFWPALGLGLGISAVAGIVYVIAWESVCALTGMDFGTTYADMLIDEQRAKGVSGEALARFVAEMEAFKLQYADPLFRLPMTFLEIFPVGVLVSLVSAALLRNPRFLPARRQSAGGLASEA